MGADKIQKALEVADRVVAAILSRRAAMDAEGNENCLFVLFAEHHHNVWEHAIQIIALEKIHLTRTAVSYGMEIPNNHVNAYFHYGVSDSLRSEPAFTSEFHDPENMLQYRTVLSSVPDMPALKVHHAVMRGIPFQLNDAAKKETEVSYVGNTEKTICLDARDSLTVKFAHEAMVDLSQNHHVSMPESIHVRNRSISFHAQHHAQKTKAKIYIQHLGFLHMTGYKFDPDSLDVAYPYEQSVMAFMKERSLDCMGIAMENAPDFTTAHLPVDAGISDIFCVDNQSMADLQHYSSKDIEAAVKVVAGLLAATSAGDVIPSYYANVEAEKASLFELHRARAYDIGRGGEIRNLPPPKVEII